jgi:lipid-A-disaccharide synthase-like uncharacterized protein
MAIFYILFVCILGYWAYSNNLIYKGEVIDKFVNKENLINIMMVFFLSIISLFISLSKFKGIDRSRIVKRVSFEQVPVIYLIYVATFVLLVLLRYVLNSQGGIFFIPYNIALMVYVVNFFDSNFVKKYTVLLLSVGIVTALQYESKREVVFYIGALMLYSLFDNYSPNRKVLRLKMIFIALFAGAGFFILIMMMSIYRGWGGYQVNNVFETIKYIPEYISNPVTLIYVINNLELAGTFVHAMNAVSATLDGVNPNLNGKTFLRMFTIGIPVEIMPFRPSSYIHYYTEFYDHVLRKSGQSRASTFLPEFYWNFGILGGTIFLSIFFSLINRLYFYFLRKFAVFSIEVKVVFCYAVISFIAYLRGPGFDLYALYILIALFVAWLIRYSKQIFL